jgi:hypothetical protein
MTTADPKHCGKCNRLIFPRLVTMGTYPCDHPLLMWKWACWCGEKKSQPVGRCPRCVGSRPPEGGDDA